MKTSRDKLSVAPEVGRWGARAVAAAGILLASLVWAALGVVAWNNAYNELAAAEQRNELVVRVMENHVTRTVETASVALASLGDAVGELREFDATRLGEMLNQMLIGMPYLRSVAVMDAEGRVLASTSALDRDLRISPALLAPLPPLSQDVLLPFLQGRGLGGFQGPAPAQGAPDPASAGVGSLPLLRHVMGPRGRDLYLVALINVDALANIDQGMLMDGGVALLADYSGLLLASTAGLPLMPGAKLTHLPVFASHLLAQDHGSYRGEGVNPSKRLVAFRASQTRPLVLIVEQSFDAVLQAWRLALVWYVVLGAIATALIAAFSVLTLRSLQELIFRTDVLGRISYVNTQWLGKRGDAAEGAVGRFLQELVEPRHRTAVAAVFAPDNLSLVRHVSASMRAVDGQLHHFDIAVVPLLDSGGTLQGFVGSAVDVTERRDAQRQLEQQLAFTELLRESSPLPLAMFDTKGRYRMVNKAWEDFLGRGRKDLQGEPAGKFSSPLEAEPFSSLDPDWDVEGGRRVAEHVVRDLYGRKRDMLINKSLVPDGRGGIVGVLCTLVDVSEIRAAERITREAAEAAQEASRAKNEFVANMSHELRTPL
ncbi:MAG: PAS domain-containing protein, partial [Paucibacter sp.]|nr:PAS domain-containing protein [Roseateles sp.]